MIDAHMICVEVPPKLKYWPLTTKSNLYINTDKYRSHIYPAETKFHHTLIALAKKEIPL